MRIRRKNVKIPAGLLRQLGAFERRLWGVETGFVLGALISACAVSYLLLFVSDRVWNTGPGIRTALLGAGVLCVATLCLRWLGRWVRGGRDLRELARAVQKRHRTLGDRLLGAVELADDRLRPENVSPALCEAAIRQVAEASADYDFRQAASSAKAVRWCLSAVCMGGLCTALALVWPSAAANALRRWLRPFDNTARFTYVRLAGLPARLAVPRGEPLALECRLDPDSRWRPRRVRFGWGAHGSGASEFRAGVAELRIPGMTAETDLHVRAGDAVLRTRLEPAFRPVLLALQAEVMLPNYLRLPDRTVEIQGRELSILEGSTFRLAGRTSRRLAAAHLTADQAYESAVVANRFKSPVLRADAFTDGTLSWVDILGLGPKSARSLCVSTTQDGAPFVDCPKLPAVSTLLLDETLEIGVLAEDDYGVKRVWLEWEVQDPNSPKAVGTAYEEPVAEGRPTARQVSGVFRFAPAAMGIPSGINVRVRVMATDYLPGRRPAVSPNYTIVVLSPARHVELLQGRFEAVLDALEEVARREEGLLHEKGALQALDEKALRGEPTTRALEEQAEREQRNVADTKELTRQTMDMMKEALRNKSFPLDTFLEWGELAQTLQDLGEQDMPQVARAVQAAGRNPEQRAEKLAAAVEAQKRVLEKLGRFQRDSDDLLKELTVRNLANRLHELAAAEHTVAVALRGLLQHAVGLNVSELAESVRDGLSASAASQQRAGKQTRVLVEDLHAFVSRSPAAKYKVVHEEMVATNVLAGLADVGTMIRTNHTFMSITGCRRWAGAFTHWAEALGRKPGGQGENGGEGESLSPVQLEFILELIRLANAEDKLRSQTRSLNERRQTDALDADAAARRAAALAGEQAALEKQLGALERKAALPPDLVLLFKRVGKAMADARSLLARAETGQPTIAAETEVIELLTSSAQSQSISMQAFLQALLQQALQALQTQGVGSSAGGEWTGPTERGQGSAVGRQDPDRAGRRASGIAAALFPEFQDAMEAYFRGLETITERDE